MLPVNGLYGHKTSNTAISIGLLALFAVAFVIAVKLIAIAGLIAAWAITMVLGKAVSGLLSTVGTLVWAEVSGPGWGALTFAIIYVALALVFHRQIVDGMTGAVVAERRHHKRLYNIVENLSMTAGVPMPRIAIIPDAALNAYACGVSARSATIAVSQGLLERLDDRELATVIAHELSHIKNGDIRVMLLLSLLGGVVISCLRRIWGAVMGPENPIETAIGTAGGDANAELTAFKTRGRNTLVTLGVGLVVVASGILPESGTLVVKGAMKTGSTASGFEEFRQMLPPRSAFMFYLFIGCAIYMFALDVKKLETLSSARKRFLGMMLMFVPMTYALATRAQSLVCRTRELIADAGAVELTKDPDALISALAKIHGHDDLAGIHRAVDAMLISSTTEGWGATHPRFDERIAALTAHAGALGLAVAQRANLRTKSGRQFVATRLGPTAPATFGRRAPRSVTQTSSG